MAKLHRVLLVLALGLFLAPALMAQSADQEVVSVVDSPDPVAPGATLTYTVTIRNNGPDPATNGGLNINLPGSVTHTTDVVPAGWTCFWAGGNGTCNTPSFAAGTTEVLTINAQVGSHLAAFPDQDISANFFPSGTTVDPNNANNTKSATTTVNSPQVDLSVSATDTPDPVAPDGTVTYNVTVTNGGPDTASTVNFNVVPNSSLQFQSATVPAGWNCTLPSVNAINATFTCSRATWAPGTSNFVVVFAANDEQFGINDTTFQTNFNVNSGSNETDNPDNSTTLTTAYVTPDADISVAVTDSPDPVNPDGNITYTVTVANAGPDTAPSVTLNSFGSNNLRFVSASVPAGWNCTLPASGTQTTSYSCTLASMVSGDSDVLTFVMQADDALLGVNDGTVLFGFSANSSVSDPVPGNNSETESTAYVTPDADVSVAVTDSPDPVFPDGNITYTVTVANAGPDTAPSVTLNSFGSNNLRFVSASVPAGWNCTLPASGTQTTSYSCTLASMVSGDSDVLTFVMQADDALLGVNDGTVLFGFSANSSVSDPVPGNNSETESTAYVTPDADISVTVTDSPDPVNPDGNITYTVTVANAGPDAAPDVTLNSFGSNNLRFVSASVPAGWNCTLPAANAQTAGFTCTLPAGMISGDSDVLTFVLQATDELLGINDGTIQFGFSANSSVSDPVPGNNSETEATAYVTPDADVSVTVSDSPDPVAPDGNITYTVTVANAGPDTAPSVTLNSFGSNNLRFVSASVPAGWNCTLPAANAQTAGFTCTLPGGMTSGDSDVLTFVLQATDELIGNADTTIQFGFSANSTISDPVPGNNSETESTAYNVDNANLGVTATDSPDPVAAGNNITYSGTVTNAGPDTATSVTLTIPLNSGLLFTSLSGPAGFSCTTPAVNANGTITCTIASLASGASLPFTLVAQVNSSLASGPDGTIEQTFLIGSSTNDPAGTNNELDVFTQYTTPDADISVTNTDTPDPVVPGGTITYTQTITNGGPDAASTVTFTQNTPVGTTFQSIAAPAGWSCATPAVGATGTITCSKATMSPSESGVFTLVVNVTAPSGTISSTVTGDSDTYDPDTTDNQATAVTNIVAASSADLSVTKTTTTTTAAPGTDIVYTIVVTNSGPDAATTVVLSDTLPAQLQFRSITEPAGFDCVTPAVGATGTITCTAATLANGASATFTLTARVAPGATSGTVTNAATVTSATADPDSGDTTGTAPGVTLVTAVSDLSITKNTASTTAPAGSTFSYTIAVTNAGPNAASNVVMTDVLPGQLLFESIAIPTGFTCTTPAVGTNGTITCTAATLASGVTRTFTLNVRVASSSTSGTVTNTAGVTTTSSDPDGGDASDPAPPVTLAPASADLSITKTTPSANAPTGGTLTYTITVTNAGPSAATGVVVTDTLPAGLQLITATPSQGTCSGTTTVTCNLGTINNGSNATITLQTLVTATSGTVANTASVDSPVSDPDEGDTSTTTPPIPVGGPTEIAAIPTMSEWALMLMAALLGMLALVKMR